MLFFRPRRYILIYSFLAFAIQVTAGDNTEKLDLKSESRIVFIGNTFAERLQYYNYFETLLYKSYPGRKITVRNLGWSADEIGLQSRPLNFASLDKHITDQKADIIFACYGQNEAFKGPDSLARFKEQLGIYLRHLKSHRYNGRSAPKIILVSPVAHERPGSGMPDPVPRNQNLALYVQAMAQVAQANGIEFINIFDFTKKLSEGGEVLTINGIHLNEKGYRLVGEFMAGALGFTVTKWKPERQMVHLKTLIDQKNQQFFYLYRAVNSEYIIGRRKEPWVQPVGGPISYPGEFAKLGRIVTRLDSVVWSESRRSDPRRLAEAGRILNDTVQYVMPDRASLEKPTTDQFILPEGFEINLFASEVDFSISNPVKISFDPQGRLWIADMPSYPQYLPGAQTNDKIIILEDTNGDGTADKETIFADSLYMPTSFELGKKGVYVSQPPNIWFMEDTNGDGKADKKEIILHGFGTEDVHHSIDTYTWGPDGALYWHTGTFLHSQIETPYGPRRDDYGTTWRFEPHTQKLEPYISYPFANPWGHVFLRDGTQIISDVSTGRNYFAPPMTVASTYPVKRTQMNDFLTARLKPKTCGTEIISSRQFPDEMQGNILFNTFVGFQGIRRHIIRKDGSGIIADEAEPLLQSTDPNFRPVDLLFGPDGALYIADWYNPIINHGERALRDPLRDHTRGRIWRLTYKPKKIPAATDLTKLPVNELLNQLKEYEDRLRYRTRTQLRQLAPEIVLPALEKWLTSLNKNDSLYDQHRLEGLWVYQQFNHPDKKLLDDLLESRESHIRTAATRVMFFWKEHIPDAEAKLIGLTKDSSADVRLQAIVSLSHFSTENAVNALLDITGDSTDYYIGYALKESFRFLKPVWFNMFRNDRSFLADAPEKAAYLLGTLSNENELKVPGHFKGDPVAAKYQYQPLTAADFALLKDSPAVTKFLSDASSLPQKEQSHGKGNNGETPVRLSVVPSKMLFDKSVFSVKSGSTVFLVFENADEMPHNLVITSPDALEKVGMAADAMAATPDGYQQNFVPSLPEVLFSTPLVPAGESHKMVFKAPVKPGEYPFTCTFPGHWRAMKGIMKVEP